MDIDVENSLVDQVKGGSSSSQEFEGKLGYYQKLENSTDNQGTNFISYPGDGDPKEIEKNTVTMGIATGSSATTFVYPMGSQIEGNIAQIAETENASRLTNESSKQSKLVRAVGSSELLERGQGTEIFTESQSALGSSRNINSISEWQPADRSDRVFVEKTRESINYCLGLYEFVHESLQFTHKYVKVFLETFNNEYPESETINYCSLSEIYKFYLQSLIKNAEKLENIAINLEETAVNADQNATVSDDVTDDLLHNLSRAVQLQNATDSMCTASNSHSPLRPMRQILTNLKNIEESLRKDMPGMFGLSACVLA